MIIIIRIMYNITYIKHLNYANHVDTEYMYVCIYI